jgi:fatty acid CoA ligase FadD32
LTTCLADGTVQGTAFTFVDYSTDRAGIRHEISWAELRRRVDAVAAALLERTAPGDRVAVLTPQNLDYVVGFLGVLRAGRIGVPLFAPEVSMHGQRLVGALADSAPAAWLTSSDALEQIHELAATKGVPAPADVLVVDEIGAAGSDGFEAPELDLDAPAYLQYTSGSTRNPAGAVITHRALVSNAEQTRDAYGITEEYTCAGWIPFFHDMGLIQMLCLPVRAGASAVFTTPFAFIRKPLRWLQMLADHPNTMSAAPNFAFEFAAAKISADDRALLDLSGVRVIVNGSEPVRASTVEQFAATFGPCGFAPEAHRPSYGLAEATVFVSTGDGSGPVVRHFNRAGIGEGRAELVESTSDSAMALVSAGRPLGQHVRIVDPATNASCADGRVGEIWVHGPNVAAEYWKSPQRTEETFRGVLADPVVGVPADRWLRTGDLGVLHDDQLYITGRMKDLIIIDGKNHYPQDIELTAQDAHPAIRRDHVAAFSVERDAVEGAVVVAEVDRRAGDVDEREVGRAVKRAVSAVHDVKLVGFQLVGPGQVERTSSGKVARAATRTKYVKTSESQAGQQT